MLQNKTIPADRKTMSAKDLAEVLAQIKSTDKDCKVKNPFTSGLNFENGEKVTFVGFNYSEWEDDGIGTYANGKKHEKAHGCYPVFVLKSGAVEKTLSITSLLKSKVGRLLDTEKNPDNAYGMWTNDGGLATVAKSCTELSEADFAKLANWFGTTEHTIRVQWIENDRGFVTSLVNIL